MNNNKLSSIWLFAILGFSIFSFSFGQNIQKADAQLQPVKIDTTGFNILEVHYQESTEILWALSGSLTSGSNIFALAISPINGTILNSYNVTSSANSGTPRDIWCGVTSCFITTRIALGSTPLSTVGSIIRIETEASIRGNVTGTYNANTNDRGFGRIDGRDSTSTGIGGISLYVETYNSSGQYKGIIVGGIGTLSKTADISFGAVTPLGGTNMSDLMWTGRAGVTNNLLIVLFQNLATTENIYVYNLASLTNVCNASINVTSGTTGGQIIYDEVNNIAYIPTGSSGAYASLNTSTCATSLGEITATDTGLSSSVTQKNGIAIPSRDLMFFQESGANARISTDEYIFDTQTFSGNPLVVETVPNNLQSATYGRAYYAIEHDNNGQSYNQSGATIGTGSSAYNGIFIPMNTDETIFVYKFSVPSEPDVVTGINCSLPENVNILICRLTAQTGGNIGGLGGIIDTGIFNLFVNSGLIDGTNMNPQTNGVGYFILASTFAIMIGVFFVASKNNLDRIPDYIYMITSVAIVAGLTTIGWIDPTLLIISIIIVSALAVRRYRDTLGSSFGGGDFR